MAVTVGDLTVDVEAVKDCIVVVLGEEYIDCAVDVLAVVNIEEVTFLLVVEVVRGVAGDTVAPVDAKDKLVDALELGGL